MSRDQLQSSTEVEDDTSHPAETNTPPSSLRNSGRMRSVSTPNIAPPLAVNLVSYSRVQGEDVGGGGGGLMEYETSIDPPVRRIVPSKPPRSRRQAVVEMETSLGGTTDQPLDRHSRSMVNLAGNQYETVINTNSAERGLRRSSHRQRSLSLMELQNSSRKYRLNSVNEVETNQDHEVVESTSVINKPNKPLSQSMVNIVTYARIEDDTKSSSRRASQAGRKGSLSAPSRGRYRRWSELPRPSENMIETSYGAQLWESESGV